MLTAGQTILLPKPGHDTAHLWVVVVSASKITGEAVIVNLTTQRTHSDPTVILQPGDHPFVQHATVAFFADARIVDGRLLAKGVEACTFRKHVDCSPALLQRIQEGLFSSPHTPNKVKVFAGNQLSQA